MALIKSANTIISSLRITSADITIVSVDVKSQSIVSSTQTPLPQGAVNMGKVSNFQILDDTLKKAAASHRNQSSGVIIGFPEDKTFATTINISGVSQSDLKEAVSWQAKEILPAKLDDLYYDWKLLSSVKKTSKQSSLKDSSQKENSWQHSVLIVSAPRSLVDPIAQVSINAGLTPLSCEPTSHSLARLAPGGKTVIMVEVRQIDSTVSIVDESKIAKLSTVVSTPDRLAAEILSMNSFYSAKNKQTPTELIVCGEGATGKWQEYLKNQTKMKVTPLPLSNWKNLGQNPLSLAVSLSLTQKDPAPPKQPQTINLLPDKLETAYQQEAEKKSLYAGFKSAATTLAVTAFILVAGLIMIRVNSSKLQIQISEQEQRVSQTSYSDLARQAESANARARILSRLPIQDNLRQVISQLQDSSPIGITVTTFTLNLSQKVLLIAGTASTRDTLLEFKDQLETSQLFSLVTIPLPTLEKQNDIQFSIAVDISGG